MKDVFPPVGLRVLFYWRPIDFKERPYHKEIIIGELSIYGEDNKKHDPPLYVWASNGRYYDIKTHITDWAPLPDVPDKIYKFGEESVEMHGDCGAFSKKDD